MQVTDFFSSSPTLLLLHHQPAGIPSLLPRRKKPSIISMAASSSRGSNSKGRDYGGRLVDENMIVLRLRIRETKLSEKSDEQLPSDWMEWEKKYYVDYTKDVCEAMGLLQNCLMDMRPSFTLGMIAIVILGVLVSSGVALLHAVEIIRTILSGFRMS